MYVCVHACVNVGVLGIIVHDGVINKDHTFGERQDHPETTTTTIKSESEANRMPPIRY